MTTAGAASAPSDPGAPGIVLAWLFTLPVTTVIAGGLYYLLADPRL